MKRLSALWFCCLLPVVALSQAPDMPAQATLQSAADYRAAQPAFLQALTYLETQPYSETLPYLNVLTWVDAYLSGSPDFDTHQDYSTLLYHKLDADKYPHLELVYKAGWARKEFAEPGLHFYQYSLAGLQSLLMAYRNGDLKKLKAVEKLLNADADTLLAWVKENS